ncbi:MAG: class I SAM-dependent methyltransferase [Microcystaceae cyanobacterium]
MSDLIAPHYDKDYFDWQAPIGEFGGWANMSKFADFISSDSRVLDFGCGGGFLLKNINCAKKVGVEVNFSAMEVARNNGAEVFRSVAEVPDNYVNVIISTNALEHTLQPLEELKMLYQKLEAGGKIIFVVPCESINMSYDPNNIDHHLYSWSPMCLGNLFSEAGFSVIESKAYIHKWPPKYKAIAKYGGRNVFEIACRIYGRINNSWSQVKVIAEKKKANF